MAVSARRICDSEMKKREREGRSRGWRYNYINPLKKSGKDVTVGEFFHDVVVTNEPLIILLKDTISDAIAELVDDSIET